VNLRVFVLLWLKKHTRQVLPLLISVFGLLISGQLLAQQENIKATILSEVNKVRASGCKCGRDKMPPAWALSWSDKLEKAAVRHAKDMFDNEHFDHKGTDGSTLSERINATGYKWTLIGENISFGYSDASEVVQGWISSPGHCRNMMNPSFKEMGAAKAGSYWVLDLGATRQQ
jgi:uncharacterized protein YkwD